MPLINSLSHFVAGKLLFDNISLQLGSKKYGLVGPNGVGKTTLAKILCGDIQPTQGHIVSEGVTYIPQSEAPDDTLLSDYLLSIWEADTPHLKWISDSVSGLDLTRKNSELSGGEWMKARLLKAFSKASSFLILDEPTNNLDSSGKEFVLSFIKNCSTGLLLISHDRDLLQEMDVIIELSNQGITTYGGNFNFYWQQSTLERERAEEHLEELKRSSKKKFLEQKKKLDRQQKRMRAGAESIADSGLPKILLGARKRRAQATLGHIIRREKNVTEEASAKATEAWKKTKIDPFIQLNFKGADVPANRIIISASDVNWTFTNAVNHLWKMPLSFAVKGRERWHICGKNGSGKSTLLKILMATSPGSGHLEGSVFRNSKAIGYLDQKYGSLNPDLSILENFRRDCSLGEVDLRNQLALYGFTGDKVFQKVEDLSGGETLKTCLAYIFIRPYMPEVLVLDEPTNNLDLQSLALLEEALRRFSGVIIVSSHDNKFVESLEITHTLDLDNLGPL